MMTHRSIKSSEVHVRTKPALRMCQPSFQKVVCDFLKRKNIPQVTEHGLRSNGEGALSSKVFYTWRRLAHLRGCFLYMAEGEAVALVPPFASSCTDGRDAKKAWTIRVPINHRLLASVGPVVCEAYWDPMDHDLTINDVLYYNKEFVWDSYDFSERYQLLHTIVNEVIQNTGDYSDCTVSLPPYEKLEEAARWDDDKTFCVVFQPEDHGSRRFRFWSGTHEQRPERPERPDRQPRQDRPERSDRQPRRHMQIQSDDESESDADAEANHLLKSTHPIPMVLPKQGIQNDPDGLTLDMISEFYSKLPAPTPIVTKIVKKNNPIVNTQDGTIECILELDTKNPLPDVYKLRTAANGNDGDKGADYGVAAVRSLALSLEIRSMLKAGNKALRVDAAWYAPFKKWEVVKVLSA
jgi:hypothetical protein